MTWVAATTPYYFKPADTIIDNQPYLLMSGEFMAVSPALFAYYHVTDNKLAPEGTQIRVVSIGSTDEMSERISQNTGLIDWATRLTSLTAISKKHTMDYFLQAILRKLGHELHTFEIPTTK